MPPKKKDNLDDLKQELDIDYHKISCEELYQRFQTHPENVSQHLTPDFFMNNKYRTKENLYHHFSSYFRV
jgi:hypothetical protein